jgi:hypothetical protein
MRRTRIATAAAAGVAVVALLGASPAGAQEFLPIEVSPTSGPAGTVVTVSGDGCIAEGTPGVVDVVLFFEAAEDPVLVFSTTPEEVAADGSWSTGFIAEATDPPGLYDVTATCFTDAEGADIVAEYDFATFELTAPTPTPGPTTPPTVPVTPQAPPATPVTGDPDFTG